MLFLLFFQLVQLDVDSSCQRSLDDFIELLIYLKNPFSFMKMGADDAQYVLFCFLVASLGLVGDS